MKIKLLSCQICGSEKLKIVHDKDASLQEYSNWFGKCLSCDWENDFYGTYEGFIIDWNGPVRNEIEVEIIET